MKRLVFLLAFLAAFLLHGEAEAATMKSVYLSPTTVSGGATLTGTVYLSSAAGTGGEEVTLISSNVKANVPASVMVLKGKTSATFTITTDDLTSRTTATISATADGVTKSAVLTIDPLALTSVTMSPMTITGETSGTGTVKLNGKAKTGGFVVSLASNSSYLDVPSSVTVPAGATSVTFVADAAATSTNRSVTITATASGVTKTTKPTVSPLSLKSISASLAVNSGRTISPKVNMSGLVPEGGAVVTLNSNRPSILPVPASVTVPEGATYLSVPLTANFVSAPTQVTLTARYAGVSKTVVVTVNPVVVSSITVSPSSPTGSMDVTFTVTLSAPANTSGYTVVLSSSNEDLVPLPDTIFIPGGQSSASLVLSTSYTDEQEIVALSGTLHGVTKSYNLTVKPVHLSSVLYTSSPTGGISTNLVINLATFAPEGGIEIDLVSSNPALINLPATVTVPEGLKSLTVPYTPAISMSSPVVTVIFTDGTVSKTVTITIKKPRLYSVGLNAAITIGGTPSTGTIVLTGPAPEGGALVQLTGNSPAVVPTEVLIPEGEKEASLSFNTIPVTVRTTVSVTAMWDGVSFSKTLVIDPPTLKDLVPRPVTMSPGGSSPLTVRLTGPAPAGGYVVNLTSTVPGIASVPATVTVPAGSPQVTFLVSAPVSATNGQSATIRATVGTKTVEATASVTTLTMTGFSISHASVIGGSNLTGTVTLSGPAPVGGLIVDVFTLDANVTPANPVLVAAGQTSATFQIATNFVAEESTVIIYASFISAGLTEDLTLTPLRPTALTLDVSEIEGGDTATATLTMNGPAPSIGGLVVSVNLSTSNGAATVPATVIVAPGASSATFSVTGVPMAEDTSVTIYASFNGGDVSASLTVNPPALESLSLDLSEVTGGHQVQGTVELTSPAPDGGWMVNLSADSVRASVPATVTVGSGQTTAVFTINTAPVAVNTDVTVTASKDAIAKTSVFTIIPPKLVSLTVDDSDLEGGFASAQATVNLDGPAPELGWVIELESSNGSALSVVSMVVVMSGDTSATVSLPSAVVAADTTVTVTATEGPRSFERDIMVRAIKVTGLTLSTSTTTGGTDNVVGTISINRTIPSGEVMMVNVTTDHAAAGSGSPVMIGGGEFTKTFDIITNAVSEDTTGTFTATFNGSASASLTVIPPVVTSMTISPDPAIGGIENPVGTVTLNGPAPAGGATIALESVGTAGSVPASMTIDAGMTSGTFTMTTVPVAVSSAVSVEATYQESAASDSVVVNPLPIQSVSLSPSTVIGGAANSTATITTLFPAPAGGTLVTLSSSNSSAAAVQSSVMLPGGATTITVPVLTSVTATSQTVAISATTGVVIQSANLTVNPLLISTITLNKGTVQGGSENVTATVTMNAAPLANTEITLASSNTLVATVPATVTVLAGETTATFTVTTLYQNTTANISVSASFNSGSKSINLVVSAVKLNTLIITPSSLIGGTANATGSITLSTPATSALTVALVSDCENATVPATVTVAAGQATATFTVTTSVVDVIDVANITATFNGTSKTDDLTNNPHVISSATLNKSSVIGGAENLTLTVTLNGPAPAGGVEVDLEVAPTTHASVPATMTIAAGATTGTATVTTVRQPANAVITVTAEYNGSSQSATATVKGPLVTAVAISPSPVLGGTSTTGTITLDVSAPVGGLVVDLTASNSGASVPATVVVAEGDTTVSFTVNTIPVVTNRSVTITATVNGVNKTKSMQVNAPGVSSLVISPDDVVGGTSSIATVTLTGPAPAAGFLVTVTDNHSAVTVSNITVAAGQTTGTSTITTVAVGTNATATVTATANGSTKTDTMIVRAPVVTSLVINPGTVVGGTSTTGTVTISSPAPATNLVVSITDNSGNVGTPTSVTVLAGSTSVSFTITTNTVGSNQTKVVTATLNGVPTPTNIVLTAN